MDERQVVDRFCQIAHHAREEAEAQQQGEVWETGKPMFGYSDWNKLSDASKEIDRAMVGAVLGAHPAHELLRYLATQYSLLLDAHARVRMDTDEDRELHDRVVAAFRQGLVSLEQAVERYGAVRITPERKLPERTRLIDLLESAWMSAAEAGTKASPREHCQKLADVIISAAY